MTSKTEILQDIKILAEKKLITKEELIIAFDEGSNIQAKKIPSKKSHLAEILYFISGGIIFLGIAILLAQNWPELRYSTKVLATLGSCIAAYFIGLLLGREKKNVIPAEAGTERISSAFFLIFSLATPIGLSIIFDHEGFDTGSSGVQTLISGILFVTQIFSYFVFRRNIFMLFSILFGTWLFLSLTNFLMSYNLYWDTSKFYEYRALMIGLVYLLLGHAFSNNKQAPLTGFLYGFGLIGFFGAALCLGEWKPHQNIIWESAFPILTFAAIFLSVYLKRKIFLVFSTLFLIIFILKITSEYFSNSLGWPLALVIAGLLMIAMTYMSLRLSRKYLA